MHRTPRARDRGRAQFSHGAAAAHKLYIYREVRIYARSRMILSQNDRAPVGSSLVAASCCASRTSLHAFALPHHPLRRHPAAKLFLYLYKPFLHTYCEPTTQNIRTIKQDLCEKLLSGQSIYDYIATTKHMQCTLKLMHARRVTCRMAENSEQNPMCKCIGVHSTYLYAYKYTT